MRTRGSGTRCARRQRRRAAGIRPGAFATTGPMLLQTLDGGLEWSEVPWTAG